MIFFSLVLVLVAAVALVLGVFQDGLVLVYVSIGTCVAAMAVLGAAVLLRRRDDAVVAPVGHGAAARTPVAPVRRADAPAAADPPETAQGRPRPAKRAVVRRSTVPAARTDQPSAPPAAPTSPASPAAAPAPARVAATDAAARSEADLAAVRGLGPAKRGALLGRFGSVDAIASASVEELTRTPGIGAGLARAIKDQLA